MHNIKEIRNNSETFQKKLKERNTEFDLKKLLKLDEENRNLIQKKELLENKKKIISKERNESNFKESKLLTKQIDELSIEQSKKKKDLHKILEILPNLATKDVPVGNDEKSNKIIRLEGQPRKFDFTPLSHYELGKKNKLLDFDLANKTTGSRFVFLKGELALLERAISNFMLDTHSNEFGYTEISPPLIASYETMFGTGQIPKFEDDQFELKIEDKKNKKFLIPTAEVILTNMVRESTLPIEKLPIRLMASTACFRKEAGSYGKDTKGMIRQHQFYKVELVSIVDPNKCEQELDRMTNCAENILTKLKLPFRKVILSSGDMGFSAEKTYDLEVWLPSENKYREISSCSSCGQFQARRMRAKYKDKNKSDFVGTLNGSGLAVGRTLIAIMENFQEKDGSIMIPEALKPYMKGIGKIRA